ncbi:class I SAM-dependent methyltransferase [Paenibacillus piri]|nr:class I SAM-dependent methyltransferase [Paenibacillus piri]
MSTSGFYDQMSDYYHLIYPDWPNSIRRQAGHLDAILTEHCRSGGRQLLDAACGIGTQSLGLAMLGYEVTASDISPKSVERLLREAADRRLSLNGSVADMTRAYEHHQRQFDAVLACDNAVPHLLSDELIVQAFEQFYRCTRDGGCCIVSVRAYSGEPRYDTVFQPYGIRSFQDKKLILFQVQEYEGIQYNVSMYFIEDGPSPCPTYVMKSRYYAVTVDKLASLLRQAGFREVVQADDAFFQPVLIGLKR